MKCEGRLCSFRAQCRVMAAHCMCEVENQRVTSSNPSDVRGGESEVDNFSGQNSEKRKFQE